MSLRDCSAAFEAFRIAGFPPNPTLIHQISSTAIVTAKEATTNHTRIALINLYAIATTVARAVEHSQPVLADGAWTEYDALFNQIGALIAKINGPPDPDDALNILFGLNNLWMSLHGRPL